MAQDPAHGATVPGAPGYAHTIDDVHRLPYAGIGSYRQTVANQGFSKPVVSRGGVVDFSLFQPGRDKADGDPRLDPSAFKLAAGGIPRSNDIGCGKTLVQAAVTDPITHFKHLKLDWGAEKPGKRFGYPYGAGGQTWTWSQDKEVIASLGLDSKLKHAGQRFAVGADGQRYFNMFGCEDLLPAATRTYIKSDRPAKDDLIGFNDKKNLPYFVRHGEGQTKQRPIHQYWRSDSMWAVMRDEVYLKTLENEPQETVSGSRRGKNIREPSPFSEDESVDWMNEMLRDSRCKENAPPGGMPRNGTYQKRQMEEAAPMKIGPWMSLDAASAPGVTPVSEKGPNLSMTPRSVSRRDTTPLSMTPRSSLTRDATPPRRATPRLKPSPSAPFLPPRRDVSCQVTPRPSPQGVTPRGELTPRSVTPRGDTTPRAMTPRNSAQAGLSMAPVLISRRGDTTPRGSTPGASTRGLRKCASEVAISRNS